MKLQTIATMATAMAVALARGAEFVSVAEKEGAGKATVFERTVVNRADVKNARWKVTAQGVFEAFVNGKRVGNDFLKPGFTECGKCRHVYEYDVTDLMKRGAGETNVLSATVTPGWWCDQMMRAKKATPWQLGKETAFYGDLRIDDAQGTVTVGTDESWRAACTGPVVSAGIYEGETYDARRKTQGLGPVRINREFTGELRPAAAKIALREDLKRKPVSRRILADGMEVIDFGQNMSAVPRMRVRGETGARVRMRFAEMLNEEGGDKARGNDGPGGSPYLAALRSARAEVIYTCAGGEAEYLPRHTFFGYRYIGLVTEGKVTVETIESVPVTSVTKAMECGRIVTGHAKVNRLIENIRWGLYSNYLSIPTDCPQRDERMGWTADTQVFAKSAAYLVDVREFLGKYLADLRDAQFADGLYPCFAPNLRHVFSHWASCGWTDAGVILPYRLWKHYGDVKVVADHWDSMRRYMAFLESSETPYRINHGDWLAFEKREVGKNGKMKEASRLEQVEYLNEVFRIWTAEMMGEMAKALGKGDEARHFANEAARHRRTFAVSYCNGDGTLRENYRGQCNDLYALKLKLADGDSTRNDLLANIRAHGNRLQTGFLGTAILLPVLTDEAKAPETAYSLLLQEAFPSWLYSVNQGATTVWERWDGYTKEKGFGPAHMNSFNHYAYGCVMEWLFASAAGIRNTCGWKRFTLAPHPDRRLGSVKAEYDSPEGKIVSDWSYDDAGKWHWRFVIPQGTRATVTVPGGETREYPAGEFSL